LTETSNKFDILVKWTVVGLLVRLEPSVTVLPGHCLNSTAIYGRALKQAGLITRDPRIKEA